MKHCMCGANNWKFGIKMPSGKHKGKHRLICGKCDRQRLIKEFLKG